MSTRRKLVLGIAGVVLLGAGFLLGFRWYLIARVAKLRTELRGKGEKLTVQELRAGIRPPETNGALDLLSALSQLPYIPPNDTIFESYTAMRAASPGYAIVGWRQPDLRTASASRTNSWEQLENELSDMSDVLNQVSAALQKPPFDFQVDYSKLTAFKSLPLSQLKTAARLLAIRTEMHLHGQNPELALASIRDQLGLGSVLRDEPLLMFQIMRFALFSYAFGSTWEALQADGWSDEQLRLLQRLWQEQDFRESFDRALLMERAITQMSIDAGRHSSINMNQVFRGGDGAIDTAVGVTRETAQTFSDGTSHMVWVWLASYHDEYVVLQACEKMIGTHRSASARQSYKTAHEALFDHARDPVGLGAIFAQLMFGSLSNSLARRFLVEAERNMAVAAIALKRYSLCHSKLPSQLSDLVPEFMASVPIDCMDGQPLRYRLNTNGTFLLYSIGKDVRDDGGDPRSLDGKSKFYSAGRDLVWPLPADGDETAHYNEEIGNQIRKRFDQKARREQSRSKKSSNPQVVE
jgi:hypothetical protein